MMHTTFVYIFISIFAFVWANVSLATSDVNADAIKTLTEKMSKLGAKVESLEQENHDLRDDVREMKKENANFQRTLQHVANKNDVMKGGEYALESLLAKRVDTFKR